jgi:hypothetical protein
LNYKYKAFSTPYLKAKEDSTETVIGGINISKAE